MIKKYLERKVSLDFEETDIINSGLMELEYYLIESKAKDYDEGADKNIYGIEIVKRENSNYVERETVKGLSYCPDDTMNILNKLAINTVTPSCLTFVLDDLASLH